MLPVADALAQLRAAHEAFVLAAGRMVDALELAQTGTVHGVPREVVIVQGIVARRFDITRAQLISRDRRRQVSMPRLIALALAATFTRLTDARLAAAFGRDHGMVHHARRTVAGWCETDPTLKAIVESLCTECAAAIPQSHDPAR